MAFGGYMVSGDNNDSTKILEIEEFEGQKNSIHKQKISNKKFISQNPKSRQGAFLNNIQSEYSNSPKVQH